MQNAATSHIARAQRILVAEDEPGIALGLEDTLRFEGYDVEVVANGVLAGRRAMQQSFDLILLDVMLPGKDGFEVCRELRSSGQKAPIIFLSARVQEADRVSGLTLGANDYITKPFSPLELVARVRRLLQFVESSQRDLRGCLTVPVLDAEPRGSADDQARCAEQRSIRNWPFNGCCERYRRAPTP
jgi:DNA-binding response OmpR family regulator